MKRVTALVIFYSLIFLGSSVQFSQSSYADTVRVISLNMGHSRYYRKCTKHDGKNCVAVEEIKVDPGKRWTKDDEARKAAFKGMTDFLVANKGNVNITTFALQEVDMGADRSASIKFAEKIALALGGKYKFAKTMSIQGGDYGGALVSNDPDFDNIRTEVWRYPYTDAIKNGGDCPDYSYKEDRVAIVQRISLGYINQQYRSLYVISTHLSLTAANQPGSRAVCQLEKIFKDVNKRIKNTDAVLLVGDLNIVKKIPAPIYPQTHTVEYIKMQNLLILNNFKELNDDVSATFRPWTHEGIVDFALLRDQNNIFKSNTTTVVSPSTKDGINTIFFTDHNALIVDLELDDSVITSKLVNGVFEF